MSAEPADVQLRPREDSRNFRARVQFRKSHSGPPKMEGYLKKRSAKISLKWFWRKYWFVLDGKSLLYFKSQSDYNSLGTCKGLIDFGLVQAVRPTHHSKKTFAMEIITRSDIIHLCADDQETREVWVHALQGAIGIGEVSWPYGVQLDISPQLAALKNNERNCNMSSKLSTGWSPGLGDRRRKTASLLTYEHITLESGNVDTERRPSSEGAIYHQISSDDDAAKPTTPTKKASGGVLRRARSFSIGFMAKKTRLPSFFRGRSNTKTSVSQGQSQARATMKQLTPRQQGSENLSNDAATPEDLSYREKTAPNPEEEHRITVALNVNPAYQEIPKCTSLTVTRPEDTGQYAEVNDTYLAMSDTSNTKGEDASSHQDLHLQPRNSKESVDDFSLHIYTEVQRSSPSPVPSPRTVFLNRPRPVPEIPDAEDENESYYSSISEEDLRRHWSRRRGTETSETETADDSTYTTADPNDSAEELAEMDYFEDNPHIVVTAERPPRSVESLSNDAMKELREFLEYLGTDDGEGANKERPSVAKAKELIARDTANQTS
ncbi:hypothetical protein HPB47_004197 [Ixodes persulcatus]|uniref:Uncharacterized protein n=1 Tax=Ixodes persulcatus TaxID=34615 RepID=A0AC60PGH0_IXOPE|nr:hypothetical protein HPB47_004197 [Ixodes persulcatus]